ncbi:MAG: zinc ribbon domain-containing protein [Conexivisphaerales archaeon]|nr:zinc ribbon domain-containing protein [Conexivisphaerales archaeon]
MTRARCSHVKEDLELGDRDYVCPVCGWTADRDYNAALNVLRRSGSGRGPPAVPVELRPLPLPAEWQGGAMSREAPRLQLRSSSPILIAKSLIPAAPRAGPWRSHR